MPWIISDGLELSLFGTKKAVVSPAVATPKLIAICCIVLAIELALLVSRSVMSAYTNVFKLEY